MAQVSEAVVEKNIKTLTTSKEKAPIASETSFEKLEKKLNEGIIEGTAHKDRVEGDVSTADQLYQYMFVSKPISFGSISLTNREIEYDYDVKVDPEVTLESIDFLKKEQLLQSRKPHLVKLSHQQIYQKNQ